MILAFKEQLEDTIFLVYHGSWTQVDLSVNSKWMWMLALNSIKRPWCDLRQHWGPARLEGMVYPSFGRGVDLYGQDHGRYLERDHSYP